MAKVATNRMGRSTKGGEPMATCSTVLIAEPGDDLTDGLQLWVRDNGHHLLTVDKFTDLLITLQREKVNVLVMDASLPQERAYESLSIIKGLCQRLPIIICAAENNPEQEALIRQKGIFYYHVTSFGLEELMMAIANALVRSAHA